MVSKAQAILNWERQINSLKKQNKYSRTAIKNSKMAWEKKEYKQVIAKNNKDILKAKAVIKRIKTLT